MAVTAIALVFLLCGDLLPASRGVADSIRGVLQNMLQKNMRSEWGGWVTASICFGFAHITNGGFPNWRYVVLATIAGFFYGYAWRKTGSIFGSALVHTMVDFFWLALFR